MLNLKQKQCQGTAEANFEAIKSPWHFFANVKSIELYMLLHETGVS